MLADVFPDYDPLKQMVTRALNKDLPEEIRHAADKEVAKYIYPTLKAVEVTGQDGGAVQQRVRVILVDDPSTEASGTASVDESDGTTDAPAPEASPNTLLKKPPRRVRKAVVDLGVPTPAQASARPQRRRRKVL